MAKKEEFDLEFDFEKEYGIDPKELLDPEYEGSDDEDFDFSEFVEEEEPKPAKKAAPAQEETTAYESVADYELDDLLSDDFLASLGIVLENTDEEAPVEEIPEVTPAVQEEEIPDFEPEDEDDDYEDEEEDFDDYDEDEDDYDEILDAEEEFPLEPAEEVSDVKEPDFFFTPAAEPAFDVDNPDLGEDFTATFEEVSAEQHANEAESVAPAAEEAPAPEKSTLADRPKRRRKLSKERMIKEVYLPPIIAGLTLILLISFIGGAIGRLVKNNKDRQDALNASSEASASALQQEIDLILDEAAELANGYDYEAAIAKIDTFSQVDKISEYTDLAGKRGEYAQQLDQLVGYDDPSSIPNLSFHCLIADPSRAFTDEEWGKSFNSNYVTIDEFSKILQQLYDNGYVLVDFDSFVEETTSEDGKVTYSQKPLYLPADKKPIMLTETLVNYETFTIDSNGDGEADAGGSGFASKLIVGSDGEITCEYVDASGNTLTGAYDLVPILNDFIENHPGFSYRGAKAILAVTGEDGVFGYRTMDSAKADKGEDYYNAQVEGAKKIAQALRDDGYTIACYTYSNIDYANVSATQIQADMDTWKREVTPVLGQVDMLVYAKGSDISEYSSSNGRYNVLKDSGFRYYIGAAGIPWASVNGDYVRQSRIMVTGATMTSSPSTFTNYFDPSTVLNSLRGN